MASRSLAITAALLAGVAISSCGGGDGRELRPATAPPPPPTTTTTPSTLFLDDLSELTVPPSVAVSSAPARAAEIVFEQLWSPEPGVAQVLGTGAGLADAITVDGEPADIISFDLTTDGVVDLFDARIFIAEEGAHTVCVGPTCGRVDTLAPDAETPG